MPADLPRPSKRLLTRAEADWPRRGLRRPAAAAYVGIGLSKFDQLVKAKRLPAPFNIDGCVLWDIRDLDSAIDDMKDAQSAPSDGWGDLHDPHHAQVR
jgi:predicted DNA-binding transcriptional regulator AlpA